MDATNKGTQKNKTILVTDDNRVIRKMVQRELEQGGYQVIEAVNGLEALRKMQTEQIDLVILDIEMPEMDGFQTLKSIEALRANLAPGLKEQHPHIPVIFLTGSHKLEDRMRGFELGATEFFLKDYLDGEILSAVNKILGPQKREMDGILALVVDPSETFRQVITNILEMEGLKTLNCSSGTQGLEVLKSRLEDIHLIIVDENTPQINGLELCRRARSDFGLKDIPIIIISAGREQQKIASFFAAGATDYIQKPFLKEEFLARMTSHLEAFKLKALLKQKIHKLKKVNQLKDSFLAICSHDMRSPLNAIMGYSDLLLKEELSEKQRKFIGNIRTCGSLLSDLINGQLDLSKAELMGEDLALSPTPIHDAIMGPVEIMKTMAKNKDIEIAFEAKIDVNLLIPANQLAMARIVNNLLSNAIKFTPRGGRIQVNLSYRDDCHVQLSIQDNGVGMSLESMGKIFKKEFKGSTLGTEGERGAGLGLLITKSLVEKQFGQIEVTGQPQQGTCFTLVFPLN